MADEPSEYTVAAPYIAWVEDLPNGKTKRRQGNHGKTVTLSDDVAEKLLARGKIVRAGDALPARRARPARGTTPTPIGQSGPRGTGVEQPPGEPPPEREVGAPAVDSPPPGNPQPDVPQTLPATFGELMGLKVPALQELAKANDLPETVDGERKQDLARRLADAQVALPGA